ncbi:MAG: endo-1,3-alpha-glucanase family glycosylhydrolase [Kiritimatiellia bacterium]
MTMRWRLLLPALLAALSLGGAGLDERRLAWAHYVGWTVPTEVSLPPAEHYEFPMHERGGAAAFRDEVRRALDMGLDGFFVDVIVMREWRPGYFHTVEALLKAAEGTGFMVAPCLDGKTDVSNQIDQIVWMLEKFGGHPNYPRIGGKYVLATYTYHEWTPEEWQAMLDGCAAAWYPLYLVGNVKPGCGVLTPKRLAAYRGAFDGCYSFAYTGGETLTVEEENKGVADWCAANGKLFMPCVHPGYIGSWLKGHNADYIPFEGHGKFLRDFRSALKAGQWLHFTSWNDNVETTLQPMASTPGNRQLLRAATDSFKRLPPSAEKIDVSFAYHREELPGTLVRIEAVRLPAQEDGPATVSGRLVGSDGKTAATLSAQKLAHAWDRVEWLVPSAELLRNPELIPVFSLKTPASSRQGTFPALAFRTPWIENQITVHATFGSLAEVQNEFSVVGRPGGVRANLSFSAPAPVRRAILYRNDRPCGQFRAQPQAAGCAGLPLLLRGACHFELSVPGGRVIAATRRGRERGYDGFDWDEHQVVCHPTALNADAVAVWLEGAPETEAVFTTDVGDERRIRLGELAKTRRLALRNGKLTAQTFPDCTLRELPTLDLSQGALALALFDRSPVPSDAFYVRFELADGRVSETSRIRPFNPKPKMRNRPLLETSVTMETHAGAEGLPGIAPKVVYREYLTPEGEMPVRGTRRLERAMSDAVLRREFWPLEKDGRSIVSDRWAFTDEASFGLGPDGRRGLRLGGNAKDTVKLPLMMWPQDTAVVKFDLAPARLCAAPIIRRVGYGPAFTLRMLSDGILEATWSGVGSNGVWDVKPAKVAKIVSSVPLEAGKWTSVRLEYDLAELKLSLDGREVARGACPPFRAYGPNSVFLGGDGFEGHVARLSIRP